MATESRPRVSIITPVYNAEPFILSCIESVLKQSFTAWEQIIVDDGSNDRTQELIAKFDDPRIRYIRLPHRGLEALADTYNTALNAARGELIGILEGDDEWPVEKLALQVPSFDDPAVVLSWGRGPIINDAGDAVRRWPLRREFRRDIPLPEMFRILARQNILTPTLTVMARKSALEQVGGFQQAGSRLYVDLPTWLTISGFVPGVARFIDADLGLYRIHATNTGKVHIAQLRMEHDSVARAVMARMGSERLHALGWTERDEQATQAAASLTRGVALFQLGKRREARASFRDTLRRSRSAREFIQALIGYASALLGVDLIHGVFGVRALLHSVQMKFSMMHAKANER